MELAAELSEKFNVSVMPLDCATMSVEQIYGVLEEVLYEFPVQEVNIRLPLWVEELEEDFWLRQDMEDAIREILSGIKKVRDIENAIGKLAEVENVSYVNLEEMDLGTGVASIEVTVPEDLFFRSLSEVSGFTVEGNHDIIRLMKDLSFAKKEFDKVAAALDEVKQSAMGW
jgi:stage IV sporulation protein A